METAIQGTTSIPRVMPQRILEHTQKIVGYAPKDFGTRAGISQNLKS